MGTNFSGKHGNSIFRDQTTKLRKFNGNSQSKPVMVKERTGPRLANGNRIPRKWQILHHRGKGN
jgi:hypothetical protein